MKDYILAAVVTSCFTAVAMTFFKKAVAPIKKDVRESIYRTTAFAISVIATLLSWWILSVPSELKGCILFVFPVYVLQEVFDLEVIKRILKTITKAKLKKSGATDEDIAFLN